MCDACPSYMAGSWQAALCGELATQKTGLHIPATQCHALYIEPAIGCKSCTHLIRFGSKQLHLWSAYRVGLRCTRVSGLRTAGRYTNSY
jgi:hypothetical protein